MALTKLKTYGFFHPYCNAGGGGERVLWQAVANTLTMPRAHVVIYTGDADSDAVIFANVSKRFNIDLDEKRVTFLRLQHRWLVDSKTWPVLTLLGQAIGSILLAMEALSLFRPDVWLDTMGYPFTYPLIWIWLGSPLVAYVHFPVISEDMLGKLHPSLCSIYGFKQLIKFLYWSSFMRMYRYIGLFVDIVMTNSSWTQNHIKDIWALNSNISILYPPCSTEKFISPNDLKLTKWTRENSIICLAQFRPEKRHDLIISEYATFLHTTPLNIAPKLILIGSIRGEQDEAYVSKLQHQAEKLSIPSSHIEFMLDAQYEVVLEQLRKASFGLNAMWNEHFGIAVVEYVASGLIPIVHASAGPLLDIVVPWDEKAKCEVGESTIGTRTGFFFKSDTDPDFKKEDKEKYPSLAEALVEASNLTDREKVSMTNRGKECVLEKFSDEKFDAEWMKAMATVGEMKPVDRRMSVLAFGIVLFGIGYKILYNIVYN